MNENPSGPAPPVSSAIGDPPVTELTVGEPAVQPVVQKPTPPGRVEDGIAALQSWGAPVDPRELDPELVRARTDYQIAWECRNKEAMLTAGTLFVRRAEALGLRRPPEPKPAEQEDPPRDSDPTTSGIASGNGERSRKPGRRRSRTPPQTTSPT